MPFNNCYAADTRQLTECLWMQHCDLATLSDWMTWAARYNTGLLIKLTPKGVVFSFLFFSFLFFSFLFFSFRLNVNVARQQALRERDGTMLHSASQLLMGCLRLGPTKVGTVFTSCVSSVYPFTGQMTVWPVEVMTRRATCLGAAFTQTWASNI